MSVEFSWNGDKLKKAIHAAGLRGMKRVLVLAEREAKKNASGRPGPNVQTGRLRASISHRIADINDEGVIGQIGSNVEYAEPVEFGTSKRQAYPYLRPAADKAMRASSEIIGGEIGKSI